MKKKILLLIGLILFVSIVVILLYDKKDVTTDEERMIRSNLHSVALNLAAYHDAPNHYPQSLEYMASKTIPIELLKKITYTFPESKNYSVKKHNFHNEQLWFYYQYDNEAWVCQDGAVRVQRVPLDDILYKGKPISNSTNPKP